MADGLFEEFNPINRLAANQYGPSVKRITSGTLISFHYPISYAKEPNIIHDPFPMVIVTDISAKFVRGVNMHYMTFPYLKRILNDHCDNTSFGYHASVKADKYIAGAFRVYNRKGISRIKRMDCAWLLDVLGAVRSFSESELQKLREQIQAQIRERLQAKAEELTSYEDFRSDLVRSQQRALDRKVGEAQGTIQGGLDKGLIHPEPGLPESPPENI